MGLARRLADRDVIPSGLGVERRAWAHLHPIRVVVGWTVVLGSGFAVVASAAGWPMVVLAYAVAFVSGLGFLRSTDRLHRRDVRDAERRP